MKINFTIKLRCLCRGRNFSILTNARKYEIEKDCDLELKIEHDYQDQPVLELFSVTGMTAGLEQRVSIVEIARNGNQWRNYFMFCDFAMQDNSYVNNKSISPCWEICFNGACFLNVNFDRKQFDFFPFYLSKKREDFVFNNHHLDAGPDHDYWCSSLCFDDEHEHRHDNTWGNEPYLPIYHGTRKYDFGCFGCSVTRGTGLKKGSEWPALINLELGSVINLAESGSGADSIFLNLRCGLKEFNFDRMVILWPDLNRKCFRWRIDGLHLRIPITIRYEPPEGDHIHQLIKKDLAKFLVRYRYGCVSGQVARRSQRIIARTVKLLGGRGISAWHSSWSEETYSYLESLGLGSALLPRFPKNDQGAMDGVHPSAHQHKFWYESIKKQIVGIDGAA